MTSPGDKPFRSAAARSQPGHVWVRRVALVLPFLLALWLGSAGLGDETTTYTGGDPPRHLMNGVFIMDLLADRPFASIDALLDYSWKYYARYPALSLGHHPLLLPACEAIAFALGGVSLTSARIVMLTFFLASVGLIFLLTRHLHGFWAGVVAAALFASNHYLVTYGRVVMSEMPTVALLLASAVFLLRFCRHQSGWTLAAFVALLTAAMYSKHLAIYILPAFALVAWQHLGLRRLLRRDFLLAGLAFTLAIAPLVLLTLRLSAANIALVSSTPAYESVGDTWAIFWGALTAQFPFLTLALSGVGLIAAVARRESRALLPVSWAIAVGLGLLIFTRSLDPSRYSIYWMPPVLMLAASTVRVARGAIVKSAVACALALAVAFQTVVTVRTPLLRTSGYEAAAEFVLAQARHGGGTVLFSGLIDTGLFAFFVRKHDTERQSVVLRANKLFTTSHIDQLSIEDRITSPDDIPSVLRRFGTEFLVVEDVDTGSRVLNWVRDVAKSDRFVERFSVPLQETDPRVDGVILRVFEFKDAAPPDLDATLAQRIPAIGRTVSVRLGDLLDHRRRTPE